MIHHVPTPFFRQKTTYTCGPACLRMLFAFHDMLLSEEEIVEKTGTNERRGTPDKAMLRLARLQGFSVRVSYNATWEKIVGSLGKGMPVLIKYLAPDGDRHFSVIVGTTGREVIMHDPWNGREFRLSLAAFKKRWLGTAEHGKGWMMTIMLPTEGHITTKSGQTTVSS